MVLVALLERDAFATSDLCDSFLEPIGYPNVWKTDKWHDTEPESRILNGACPIVSVRRKEASYGDTPFDSLKSLVESKNRLKF